ncbi:MAG TPA: hypothetical protein VFT22_46020, partial [Kofleriaceae bacterium]|nr:hypothetical protein [Kofleriaceae bacterium]
LCAEQVALRIAGTPGYMAPEQARGLPLALDPRRPADRATLTGVDLWGLGAIAYDLLSGQPPWRAAGGLEAWEVAAGGARPEPLERTPRGERIPARLRLIVGRALASAPQDRYTSAGELADELHAMLACRPTSFDRSPARRLALWAQRNPQLTITAVVAMALAGMSLAAYATVLHLRDQRAALSAEVRAAEADEARLAGQARSARRELEDNEAALRTQSASLRALQSSLAEAETDYHAILQAKELATRALATVRGDRDIAEKARDLYESFWTRARKDADDAARERDKAARERDAARAATDQAIKERDEARAARARAEHERDAARAERDRNSAARRQAEADVARLLGELSSVMSAEGSGSAAARDHVEPAEPTIKGAVQ